MTGSELARALRDLARLVELQRSITGLQIEPVPGMTITVRVAGSARSTGKVSPSAERMRRLRAASRGLFGELGDASQPSPSLKVGDASDELGDGVADGGTMGGPIPEDGEKSGKETGSTGINLPGQDQETAETEVGDASPSSVTEQASPSLSRDGTPAERAAVARVFEAWRQDTGHHRAILDKKRGRRILARLREGFTYERQVAAIVNRRNDPFLMGQNDTGRVYDGIETLLRDAAQVERLEALAEPQRQSAAPIRNAGTVINERAAGFLDLGQFIGSSS